MRDWQDCIPRLQSDLEQIVGERHHRTAPQHLLATSALLQDRFKALGWQVQTQPVSGPLGEGNNIIATRLGSAHPERVWIVGAHHDTVPGSPGADDNGIALAGLLELARIWSKPFSETIKLVSWDMEEQQGGSGIGLFGSREMVRQWQGIPPPKGVIVLEMIGLCRREPNSQRFPPGFRWLFPGVYRAVKQREFRGDFLTALIRPNAKKLIKELQQATLRIGLPLMTIRVRGIARWLPDFYRSDHAPFWSAGIPALMLTDTANFRNGFYHTPHDTIDTIDFEFAARVIHSVSLAVSRLAGGESESKPIKGEPWDGG